MNDIQKEKIRRFAMDEATMGAVHDFILGAFLKQKPGRDVYTLAASRLAIDLLEESWRSLVRFREVGQDEEEGGVQIGL